jgi:hypothetical protein
VAERRARTVATLERAVPAVADRACRGWLLRLKRHVHAGDAPLPACPERVLADLAASCPDTARALAEEDRARRELAARVAEVGRAWLTESARQKEVLRELTAEPRFMRALSVANPAVAELWERRAGRQLPDKARHVRLEATVFRYLMRAAGRTTPQGTWAGVAPVGPARQGARDQGPALVVSGSPHEARIVATPALEPFAAVVAAWARLPRYWADYPVRLNPTAHQVGTTWRYEEPAGRRRWVELAADPLQAVLLDAYADGEARRAPPLLDKLARLVPQRPGLREAFDEALARLVSGSALQSQLALPAAPSGVWDALDAVARDLREPDRSLWLDVTGRVAAHCDRLGTWFERLRPGQVRDLEATIRHEVNRLLNSAHLRLDDRAPVVHVDMRLALEATWPAATLEAVHAAVNEVLGFHMAIGAAERLRSASLASVASALPPGRDVPLHTLLSSAGPLLAVPPQLPPVVTEWDHLLHRDATRPALTLPPAAVHARPRPGPAGALLLSLALPPGSPVRVRAEWGRPQPGLFASRWDAVLSRGRMDGTLPDGTLSDALARELARWHRSGVRAVEIVGSDPANLNTAVRPPAVPLRLDPHGATGLRPAGVTVRIAQDRPWLHCAGLDAPLVPVYGSAAAIGGEDTCSRLILQLAMAHGWELLSLGSPLLAGRRDWPHLPRVVLPGGTVLSGERWSLDRGAVATLAGRDGPEQYLEWRAHAERLGLPGIVWVGSAEDPDPERLVLRTDSPLAVRYLFREVARAPAALEFVEAHGEPATWPVRDARGRHHLAEVAVSWFDDTHWTSLGRAASDREG